MTATTMKPWERQAMQMVEAGLIPFGKKKGQEFSGQEDGYILWWSDQEVNDQTSIPATAVIARFKEIAIKRDLFTRRDAAEAASLAQAARSRHVGTEGTRQTFTAVVERIRSFENRYGENRMIQRLRSGDDLLVYWGFADLGMEGQTVTFDAKVRNFDEYNGEKQTIVNRPTKVTIH